jgi:hypothetical protein
LRHSKAAAENQKNSVQNGENFGLYGHLKLLHKKPPVKLSRIFSTNARCTGLPAIFHCRTTGTANKWCLFSGKLCRQNSQPMPSGEFAYFLALR